MSLTKREKLDRIAELWAVGTLTEDIARRLKTTKGSVCRMARDARLSGDPRFPARPRSGRLAVPKPSSKTRPCLFVDLAPNECKFPVRSEGERGEIHWFCAEPRFPGSPYCKPHKDLTDNRVRAPVVSSWVKP